MELFKHGYLQTETTFRLHSSVEDSKMAMKAMPRCFSQKRNLPKSAGWAPSQWYPFDNKDWMLLYLHSIRLAVFFPQCAFN